MTETRPTERTRVDEQRAAALRSHWRQMGETDGRPRRWHYKPAEWDRDTLFDLEGSGHLERVREDWKNIYVRVTPAGRDWLREYEERATKRANLADLLRGKSTREAVDDPAVRRAFGFDRDPEEPRR